MKQILILSLLLVVVVAVGAVSVVYLFPYPPHQPPRVNDTAATPEGVQRVVEANNQFAFDLYAELSKEDQKNLFFSPYSISTALAMTFEGAQGATAEEIQSVFHFPQPTVLRENFAAIYNTLNRENQQYSLRTGNAIWVQKAYPFLESYLSRIEQYYGGKATNLDFVGQPEAARHTINQFIEEQTQEKIKNLLPPKSINAYTRLVLTNAIYFKGTWEWEFDSEKTRKEEFTITPERTVKTQMMHMKPEKARFNYVETEELQMLELPYKGSHLSMLVILPKDTLLALEPSLTAENLDLWKSQMQETNIDSITMPTFEFDTKYLMNDALSTLGMPTAFSESADFSGMDGTKNLFISFVIHQAYVKVDEKGTEAAAATAVGLELSSAPVDQTIFNADHPFVFLIQEKSTGNILFLGKVVDPRPT